MGQTNNQSSEKKSAWWIFFPLKGLDIIDQDHDLDSPLFGDSTVISKSHIPSIVKRLKLNEHGAPGFDHEGVRIQSFQQLTFDEEFHSLVAVKRTGLKSRNIGKKVKRFDPFFGIEGNPENRAKQIAALVGLALLVENQHWETCALVNQINRHFLSTVALSLETGSWFESHWHGHARTIFDSKRNLKLSREELNEKLGSPPISFLTEIIITGKGGRRNSLTKAITESSIRLFESLHNPSESTQLLGAVTAIDILLSDSGDTFDTIKRRIISLVGNQCYQYYNAESVLKERHLYVHQGIEPSHKVIPLSSSGLGLACLLRFAEIAKIFPSKVSLLNYLDFLYSGSKIYEQWTLSK